MPTDRSSESHRIAVFDVCNTLFAENTTAGFVEHYCRSSGLLVRNLLLPLIRRRWSPFRIALAALHRFMGVDLSKRLLIGMLAGEPQRDLERVAKDYVDWLIEERRVEPVWAFFEREMRRSRIVFASASLCVVMDELGRRFGADVVSSRLGYSQNRCTGKLASDATGRKCQLIQRMLPGGSDDVWLFVCTDNLADVQLLLSADEGVAVIYPGSRGLRRMALPDTVKRLLVHGPAPSGHPCQVRESE